MELERDGEEEVSAVSQSGSQKQKKIQKSYDHVKGKRRPKGEKNSYQAKVNGYWTKNILPFAKKPHFDFIEASFGSSYVDNNEEIKDIKNKKGMTMNDFVTLYSRPELEAIWEDFFISRTLYRELMISRTEYEYRLVYVQFLNCFENAFRTKKFEGISRILSKDSTEKNERKRS